MTAKAFAAPDHVSNSTERLPLVTAATYIGMSPNGLLYILKRTNSAIRDDGHWFCAPETIQRIKKARQDLGFAVEALSATSHHRSAEQQPTFTAGTMAELHRMERQAAGVTA